VLILRAVAALAALTPIASLQSGDDDARRRVVLEARDDGEATSFAPVVDRLVDGEVIEVEVHGGLSGHAGTVRQCVRDISAFVRCHNQFPVQFGDGGDSTFQYQLSERDGCGATGACVLVVSDIEEEVTVYAHTIFGEAALAPPTVTLSPPGPYEQGDRIDVNVTGAPAGLELVIRFCGIECGDPVMIAADGDGAARVSVRAGERCVRCGVVVEGGTIHTLATVAFTPPPTAEYDVTKLVLGLGIAALLLLLASVLVATVDWRPPSEAATPDLDLAEP
jgi:hypothetical protein